MKAYHNDLGSPRSAIVLCQPDGTETELRPGTHIAAYIGRYYLCSPDRMPPKLDDILEQIEIARSEPARANPNDPRMLADLPLGHVLESVA